MIRNQPQILRLGFACLVAVALVGCDEKLSDLAGPSPDLEPTFASVQREIFEKSDSAGRAACTQCHTDVGRTPPLGLNLRHETAYNALSGVSRGKPGARIVVPGAPDASYLVQKLEGRQGIAGERMPRTGGPYLTPGQMTILKRWIANGAKND